MSTKDIPNNKEIRVSDLVTMFNKITYLYYGSNTPVPSDNQRKTTWGDVQSNEQRRTTLGDVLSDEQKEKSKEATKKMEENFENYSAY
jgi:hypothetical protein